MFQYMAGRHQGVRGVQPIALKDPTSKAYEQQRIKAVQAETQAMSEEEKYYAQKHGRQQQEAQIQQHHAKIIKMRQDLQGKEEERYWAERKGKQKILKETQAAFATQQEIAAAVGMTGVSSSIVRSYGTLIAATVSTMIATGLRMRTSCRQQSLMRSETLLLEPLIAIHVLLGLVR